VVAAKNNYRVHLSLWEEIPSLHSAAGYFLAGFNNCGVKNGQRFSKARLPIELIIELIAHLAFYKQRPALAAAGVRGP